MLFRYSGIDLSGKKKMGIIDVENYSEALRLVKEEEEILVITNLKKQNKNPIIKKTVEIYQKQMEQISNKMEENRREAKSRKLARIKAKKEKLLKKQQKQGNSEKKSSRLNLSSLLSIQLPSISKKNKVEMDEEMYNEIFKALKLTAERVNNGPFGDAESEIIIKEKREENKPKLKADNPSKGRPKNAKEKEIDWSVFKTQELSPVVKKNMKLKVKPKEILLFTKRLQIMLSSGMTLVKSLMILSKTKNKTLNYIVEKVIDDIQNGTHFSEALSKFPRQFDYTYVSLVSIGESSGTIDSVLLDIIEAKEKQAKVNKKLKTATIYPRVIGVVLVVILMLGSLFFIPSFKTMFNDQGYSLPVITQIVFTIADFLPLLIIGTMLLIVSIRVLKRTNKTVNILFKKYFDRLWLHVPIVKNILITSYMYNFSFTTSLMLKNGIRLKDALALSEKTINNIYVKNEINDMISLMIQGMSFSEAMAQQKYFDDILRNIVLTGEESGQLNFSLAQISKYYSEELDRAIDTISELVQPVSIILVALIVIPVVIAVYLPIVDLSSGALLDI